VAASPWAHHDQSDNNASSAGGAGAPPASPCSATFSGDEDHLGDMDFKSVAPGWRHRAADGHQDPRLDRDISRKALYQAREDGSILDKMLGPCLRCARSVAVPPVSLRCRLTRPHPRRDRAGRQDDPRIIGWHEAVVADPRSRVVSDGASASPTTLFGQAIDDHQMTRFADDITASSRPTAECGRRHIEVDDSDCDKPRIILLPARSRRGCGRLNLQRKDTRCVRRQILAPPQAWRRASCRDVEPSSAPDRAPSGGCRGRARGS